MRRNPFEKYLSKEDLLQQAVMNYIGYQYGSKCLFWHTPNEGKRTKFEQFKAKVLGIKSGVSDVLILYKGRLLALELKSGRNKPTENQNLFLSEVIDNCGTGAWVNSFDEAKEVIDAFFLITDNENGQRNEIKKH